MKRIRKKIRHRVRYLKDEHFKSEADKLNIYALNRQIEKLFMKAKSQETTLKPTYNTCPTEKLFEHFKTHFNPQGPSTDYTPEEMTENIPKFVKDLQNISDSADISDTPPTIDEIQKHIQKLKNNKASNDIEPELLKRCSHPIMLEVIHRITDNLWSGQDLPNMWGQSLLRTLWKGKGSQKDPSKYRGLSIGSTVCKLVVNIILARLNDWYEKQISDEQNGFRSNRRTTDGIYTVKRVDQISHRKKQCVFLLFVDLSAAFDHIPRKWLFDSIKLRFSNNTSPILIEILEKLYRQTSLLYDGKVFETTSGVRQGGPESPFLFNLYIDFVMRLMIERSRDVPTLEFFVHKYRINSNSISRDERLSMRKNNLRASGISTLPWCGYADDLVLFLQNELSLQIATNLLNEIFTKFGLTINSQKTETMVLNHPEEIPYPTSIANLNGNELSNVSDFKYLGAYLKENQPNTGEKEINHRIQLAVAKFSEKSNVLQNFHINLKTRVFFLNSFVRSRLVYACQNWNLNREQFDRLDVSYRKFLRRIVRGGFRFINEKENDFRYRIDNAQLHRICGSSDVSFFIKSQQHHYASHVIRMPSTRSLKLLTFNDDHYTRRGRPSKSLIEQVVDERSISISQYCSLALSKK